MRKCQKIFFFVLVCLLPCLLYSHSGRTDAYGGHNNRQTGGYHYHNAGSAHAADNSYQNHDKCGICNELKTKEVISLVQKLLKEKDLYSGEITGSMNDLTIESIKKVQPEYGIPPTGKITEYFLANLKK